MHYKTVFEANLMQFYHEVEFYGGSGFKFEVIASCHHIFEPQEGDKNIDGYVFNARERKWYDKERNWEYEPHQLPISERNGKAFIMPERE